MTKIEYDDSLWRCTHPEFFQRAVLTSSKPIRRKGLAQKRAAPQLSTFTVFFARIRTFTVVFARLELLQWFLRAFEFLFRLELLQWFLRAFELLQWFLKGLNFYSVLSGVFVGFEK
jgi:hypothetical protein